MQGALTKFEVRDAGDGCHVVRCHGGLSWDDREMLAASVADHLADSSSIRGVVLDFNATEYVNSAGLGALFQLVRWLRVREARLTFANVPPLLARLFRTVGLDSVGGLHDDVNSALAALRQSGPAASGEAVADEWPRASEIIPANRPHSQPAAGQTL
jgi:anti-anti-sigma factor